MFSLGQRSSYYTVVRKSLGNLNGFHSMSTLKAQINLQMSLSSITSLAFVSCKNCAGLLWICHKNTASIDNDFPWRPFCLQPIDFSFSFKEWLWHLDNTLFLASKICEIHAVCKKWISNITDVDLLSFKSNRNQLEQRIHKYTRWLYNYSSVLLIIYTFVIFFLNWFYLFT